LRILRAGGDLRLVPSLQFLNHFLKAHFMSREQHKHVIEEIGSFGHDT
jgi:hypothetical protein